MVNKLQKRLVQGYIFEAINNRLHSFFSKSNKKPYKILSHISRSIDRRIAYFPRKSLSKKINVSNDTVMFLTYQGDYTCNPRAVADEMIKQKVPCTMYWVVKGDTENQSAAYPKELKLVKRGSYEFYDAVARTKVFVDNTHDLARLAVRKKEDQVLMQTWHGSLGIKRLDGDIVMNRTWKRLAEICREDTSYCISNSDFETEVFHTSYWKDVPILDYGHARNDIFFKEGSELQMIKEKVYSALKISPDKNVLLYAPTHKDGENEAMFELDYKMLKDALETRFGGSWVIALRFHARLKEKYGEWIKDAPGYVVDATDYDDIQELMMITDIGLTDYSSWIFDYILLRRPGFILANDLETFKHNRSFYYPLESTPFPIATTNEELKENILNFDESLYPQRVEEFLKARGCSEDGHASERIVKKIREIIKK